MKCSQQQSGDDLSIGGAEEDRTPDLLRARQALSQLSYGPVSADPDNPIDLRESLTEGVKFPTNGNRPVDLVGLGGVEPPTSPLSGVRSNQLSYRPKPEPDSPKPSGRASHEIQSDTCECPEVEQASRKEVIQPQVPLRLPCYDFVPVMDHTVGAVLPKVRLATSGATHSHDVTGGVYKARERIHRDMLIRDY